MRRLDSLVVQGGSHGFDGALFAGWEDIHRGQRVQVTCKDMAAFAICDLDRVAELHIGKRLSPSVPLNRAGQESFRVASHVVGKLLITLVDLIVLGHLLLGLALSFLLVLD